MMNIYQLVLKQGSSITPPQSLHYFSFNNVLALSAQRTVPVHTDHTLHYSSVEFPVSESRLVTKTLAA